MRKKIIFAVLIAILAIFPIYNSIELISSPEGEKAETGQGIEILDLLEKTDVKEVENKVRQAEDKRREAQGLPSERVLKVISEIEKGKLTYRQVFKDVVIVGDSLMNGLEAYDILNKNQLVTQVSASLYHLEENLPRIIGMNPRTVIIHYGINMIGTSKTHLDYFIDMYERLITELKKALPDTRIIISGLFPVDRKIAVADRFKNVNAYNKALQKMCKRQKIEFLDSTPILKKHPEFYGVDGIHLSKTFYDKYWLKFIIRDKGITG